MTERVVAFTVTLENITRVDDADAIVQAIRMIRGVADVVPVVADPMAHWAQEKARRELGNQLFALLYPETKA